MHIPVLLQESVTGLRLKKGMKVVDGTLGFGGHSAEMLQHILPGGTLIGIDQDTRNLKHARERFLEHGDSVRCVHANFDQLEDIVQQEGFNSIDALLLDIGISSAHVDEAERGFSFQADGPLDMRMNPEQVLNASMIVNSYSEKQLADIIYQYGEERRSWKIARAIVEARQEKKIYTTQELATVIEQTVKNQNQNKHPALLTFQALRIAVNDELGVLTRVLKTAVKLLSPGGRLAVISYHSLEDRIVKKFFREQARQCICPKEFPLCRCQFQSQLDVITRRPIVPKQSEVDINPRSRSAKLRIAERTKNEYQDIDVVKKQYF